MGKDTKTQATCPRCEGKESEPPVGHLLVVQKRRAGQPLPREDLADFLPHNYAIVAEEPDAYLVMGQDMLGWTAHDYVIPRLASGLIVATEAEGDGFDHLRRLTKASS